jgi:hypothetical protein
MSWSAAEDKVIVRGDASPVVSRMSHIVVMTIENPRIELQPGVLRLTDQKSCALPMAALLVPVTAHECRLRRRGSFFSPCGGSLLGRQRRKRRGRRDFELLQRFFKLCARRDGFEGAP